MSFCKLQRFCPTAFAVLLLALLSSGWAEAAISAKSLERQLYTDLNRARVLAGLEKMQINKQLVQASGNHALYLGEYKKISHRQIKGSEYFTGVWPEDRVVAAGYPSRHVWEVISQVADSSIDSLNGALSPILNSVYHRLQLLNPDVDEVGIGVVKTEKLWIYVLKFGSSRWRHVCEGDSAGQDTRFEDGSVLIEPYGSAERAFLHYCSTDQVGKLNLNTVQEVERSLRELQPALIMWPPDEYSGFSVSLSDEVPRPLPGRQNPGNAISLQLSIAKGLPKIKSWVLSLQDSGNWYQVPTHLINAETDPHTILNAAQYALIPTQQLAHNTKYRIQLEYEAAGHNYRLESTFTTQSFPWDILELDRRETLWIERNKRYALFLRGRSLDSDADNISFKGTNRVKIKVDTPLPGVLLARFAGQPCSRIKMQYRSQAYEVVLKPPVPIDVAVSNYAELCRQRLEQSLKGNLVYGNGEVFVVTSGEAEIYSIVPESETDAIGKLRWVAPDSCKVKAKLQGPLTAKILLRCPLGRAVRFSGSKGRYFFLVVE
ncbi:MAG: CAP domain-containing protein [Gammaproteobacteria bacterium]